jgi:hypothetical protein
MAERQQVGDLEINQDLKFQKKEWTAERIGWISMLAISIAALLGLFGQGLLSDTTAKNGSLQVHYGRFERLLSVTELEVLVDTSQVKDGEINLQLDRHWLSYYNVQRINPEPDQSELSPEYVTYTFSVGQGDGMLEIAYNLQAMRVGVSRGEIAVKDGPALKFNQLIYP